ncbi:MAG: LemA family protein [Burkholderiaceae bacterium]
MTTPQVISLLIAATLVFWSLGAYNRLVRLRSNINQRFVVVYEQLQRRHDLLLRWAQAMEPWLEHDPKTLETLRGCCNQLQAAADQVRLRPSAARRVAALRIAEDGLAAARSRAVADMPAQVDRILPTATALGANADGGLAMPVLLEELTAAGGLLTLARQQFNDAVQDYNDAIEQFPTWILAGLFRFRSAGVL